MPCKLLRQYLGQDAVQHSSNKELRRLVLSCNLPTDDIVEKSDLLLRAQEALRLRQDGKCLQQTWEKAASRSSKSQGTSGSSKAKDKDRTASSKKKGRRSSTAGDRSKDRKKGQPPTQKSQTSKREPTGLQSLRLSLSPRMPADVDGASPAALRRCLHLLHTS
eukprot:TRINITY_DN13708_c0_g2_i6.p2 TRINITY_DN13708_c0_g2~~TRINITY_DN13708_c0_g2_i6.p2  ORF type:complete len:163 (-),score=21.20 TRINITY_DN13708_c0_g2_i6:601-1089(-)